MTRLLKRERGQVLPIMALLAVAFIGLLGLAVDVGRLYVARTELSRAVDAAALAGVAELPDRTGAEGRATDYLGDNVPDASASFPAPSEPLEFRVTGSRTVGMLFMSVFGIGDIDIDVTAAAGGTSQERDIVFVLDDSGTMNDGCNRSQSNSSCPIKQAKDAAHAFIDAIAGRDVRIGIIPFRGCYADQRYDPLGSNGPAGCALFRDIQAPTNNAGDLHNAINRFTAAGGTGTNICSGLDEAINMLVLNSPANAQKVVVVLTDGDNRYAQGAESSARGNPPPNVYPPPVAGGTSDCIANRYPQDSRSYGADYDARVGYLDTLTYGKAQALRGQNVEIFVAGYSLTGGAPDSSTCILGRLGSGPGRETTSDTRDRNLNRCLASSVANTNDHYFEALRPEEIPSVFEQILQSIEFRLVE